MAIRSFADAVTKKFYITGRVSPKAGWASVQKVAKRKLDMIHYAGQLNDLKVPPEPLKFESKIITRSIYDSDE